jgi:branched-chain amino acid aminotransferase
VSTISVWQIKKDGNARINLEDKSSLDAITRQLPEGYYSTFRTFDGGTRVLGLSVHLQRLYKPVSTPEVGEPILRRHLSALLEPYRPNEARVRAIMTRQGEVYLAIASLAPLPRAVFEKGVHVETTDLQREHPRLKSTSFIGRSDSERKHIAEEGIFEALLVKDGKILEGMTSNFFYRRSHRAERSGATLAPHAHLPRTQVPGSAGESKREAILCTTRDGILLGVTRQIVIEIAWGRGLGVKYQPLQLDQVTAINEAFITSSSRGIVPVVRIDNVTVGQGSPGPITKELMAAYESYVVEKAEKI